MSDLLSDLMLLVADAVMLGVIACVQWIIYPSFVRMEAESLARWHSTYSFRIACIVIPPMLLQLLGGSLRFWQNPAPDPGIYLALVLLLWMLTFSRLVPLHRRIGTGMASGKDIRSLAIRNRSRTLLWFLAFIWNFKILVTHY